MDVTGEEGDRGDKHGFSLNDDQVGGKKSGGIGET